MRPVIKSSVTKSSMAGFTMIELGMVLVIISLIIGPLFSYATIKRDQENYEATIVKQRRVAIALSNFAQRNGYLPCPARPDGAVLGQALTDCRAVTVAGDADRHGIVPFRALGLSPDDVIDGYGNPFTYVVSLSANDIPENNPESPGLELPVFPACYGLASSAIPLYKEWAVSRHKAYFCCRQEIRPLEVRVLGGTNPYGVNAARAFFGQGNDPDNAPPTSGVLGEIPDATNINYNLRYLAYVLISHGKNGEKSYTFGQSSQKPQRIAGLEEQENGDPQTRLFYDLRISTKSGDEYFDDIVLWRTQEHTISETGSNTCMSP